MSKVSSLSVKILPLLACILTSTSLSAQSISGGQIMLFGVLGAAALLILVIVLRVADNMLYIEAKKRDIDEAQMGLFPSVGGLLSKSLPSELRDKEVHILHRGHDLLFEGVPSEEVKDATAVTRFAVQPPNWRGIAPIPKMQVAIGDSVKAGQFLFFDKPNPDIQFVAPVSGEVIEINRGAKRAITEVVILADKEIQYEQFTAPSVESASREELVSFLLKTGGWTLLRQRPYDTLPHQDEVPVNIFISTFDSAPLAPDVNLFVAGNEDAFQKGVDVLAKLTEGQVHLGLDARKGHKAADAFANAENAEKHYFRGPHPCGNVGVQIHHIAPINSGDRVWVLGVQEAITIGNLFLKGQFDATRVVALSGDPMEKNLHARTYAGANIGELLKDNALTDGARVISGDVLSGESKELAGYVNFCDDQVTALEEGDNYEMFGWLVPGKARPSVSRTYPTGLFKNMKFIADTNTHGEKRAFVVTGQYEQVLPMDIYPQHLMKAIMAKDFERMEGLGIYELNEEDLALCEFACTSKMPLQAILREGLDMMREQG